MEVIKEKRGRRSRQARHAPRHGPYADRPHLRPRASSGSWRTSPSRDGSRRPHGRPDAPLAPRRARRRRHAYRWAAGHAGTRASGEANAQPYDTRSSKYLTCFELLFYLAHAKQQCEILAASVWICQQAQLLSRAATAQFPPRGPLMPRTGIRPARRMRPKPKTWPPHSPVSKSRQLAEAYFSIHFGILLPALMSRPIHQDSRAAHLFMLPLL